MAGSESVLYGENAAPSSRLAPNRGYRLTVERTTLGYVVWRPNALIEAWENIATTPYAWAVSPRPAADSKVAVIDVKIKSALSLPAGATVQQMVEGLNEKFGRWARIYAVKGVTQADLTSPESRQQTEAQSRQSGAGKNPIERLTGDFTASFANVGRVVKIAAVVLAVGLVVVVALKVRKAVKA